jgi:peptidoglycan/LPS O-acetylase OafA/YrhL
MFFSGYLLAGALLPGAAHALAAGGLMALAVSQQSAWPWPFWRNHWTLLVSGLLAIGIGAWPGLSAAFKGAASPVFVDAFAISLITFCISERENIVAKILKLAPLRKLGLISYGLYVYHGFLLDAVARYAPDTPSLFKKIGVLAASLVISWASWKFMEKPALRLKERYQRLNDIPA